MNVIVISNRTSIQGHEYHVACLKRYISDEDWEEFLPYIRNSRSLDLYDLYHDIRQDCEAVLPRIKYIMVSHMTSCYLELEGEKTLSKMLVTR